MENLWKNLGCDKIGGMTRGRPSTYSLSTATSICAQLIAGRSLRSICKDAGSPDESTVSRWLHDHLDFRAQYAHAREMQADRYAAEIIELADAERETRKHVYRADGTKEVTVADAVERTRLQIDARKWYASKLAPKKYGDKVQTEISGPEGGAVPVEIHIRLVGPE